MRQTINPAIYQKKEQNILNCYQLALSNRPLSAQAYVCDSHQAKCKQDVTNHAVICDIHFLDIARLVASSFYVHPTHDICRLADALLADSLLVHGKPKLALEYARKYISGPHVAAINAIGHEDLGVTVSNSVQFQTIFVLLHEIAHFRSSDWDKKLASVYEERLNKNIDGHNRIAVMINDIDLGPIQKELDAIDASPILAFPAPENAEQAALGIQTEIMQIIRKHGRKIKTPGIPADYRQDLIFYACDNYVRGVKSNLLPKDKLVNECVCDLTALFELLDMRMQGQDRRIAHIRAVEGYLLSMLTINLIHTAMHVLDYTDGRGYQEVDLTYMRREQESKLLPFVLDLFNHVFDDINKEERMELLLCYERTAMVCDEMYSEFCDYLFSQDFKKPETVPFGTEEWKSLHAEISRLLQFPV